MGGSHGFPLPVGTRMHFELLIALEDGKDVEAMKSLEGSVFRMHKPTELDEVRRSDRRSYSLRLFVRDKSDFLLDDPRTNPPQAEKQVTLRLRELAFATVHDL
ncbi:hypothetical protein [Paraburkholderia hospita]|uniref:hypothetical protein n=1 Tax=Paraburkholderia hospita TaxID=169430 RepID=UPI000271D7B2|nr:hypothetical protein [Paraburkholderia hospita]EUC18615.1 hypothetical protein PMI06_003240 [Burkholderia sp. BT03]SKC60156.1 hypothetical protein SAMN06266956_1092 [Paraburkholderia hospita]